MLKNPSKFFSYLRSTQLLGSSLEQSEVNGLNAVLAACAGWPVSWTAYALATAYHETAHTMLPIKEYGGPEYFRRMYDVTGLRPTLARSMGNVRPGDGAKYFGRGYVQLTWYSNYLKAGTKIGVDLIKNPDAALEPVNAAKIMRYGMEEGWFTRYSLRTQLKYSIGTQAQFYEARRIINGLDKATTIAGYALMFQKALQAGEWV